MGRYSIILGKPPKTRCIVVCDKNMVDFLSKDIIEVSKASDKPIFIITDRKQIGQLGNILKPKISKTGKTPLILDWNSRFNPTKDIIIYFGKVGRRQNLSDFMKWVEKSYSEAIRIVIFCSSEEYKKELKNKKSIWKIINLEPELDSEAIILDEALRNL